MDYRCPICGKEIVKRKPIHSIVTQMEIDCPHCKGRVQLNVHRAEVAIVLLAFSAIAVLAALAYGFGSQGQNVVLGALAVAGLGVAALPVLERTWLRNWPRYIPVARIPRP